MLTLTKTPPLVSLTGNPIRFTIHSDDTREAVGIQARMNIYFPAVAVENMTITLRWGTNSVVMTCKAAPDSSGTQFPDGSTTTSLYDWVVLIRDFFLANYYIAKDWTISVSGPTLLMYGKPTNLGTPSASFFWNAEVPPSVSTVTGVAGQIRKFYKIGLQLMIPDGGNWKMIGEDILPVNALGDAIFDIHTLFADHIYPEFTWPENTSQIFMDLRPHSSIEYQIQYYEQHGSPIVDGILTTSPSFYALIGGVSRSQEAIYNQQNSSFWEKLGYNQYFLSWQPKTKKVSMNQVEKLYFLAQNAMTSLSFRISFYYLDGSSQLNLAFSSIEVPPDKGVIELTVSPAILKGRATRPTEIKYYTVWLTWQSERISEIRTYIIDYTPFAYPRYFLFLNSLGGYDTLRTTGVQENSLEYERQSVTKALMPDFTTRDHELSSFLVGENVIYKSNTGWRTLEEMAWLRDFMLSKQVFLINYNVLVPMVITSTSVHQKTDGVELYYMEFEYRRSYISELYTREIITAEFTDDFNDDFLNE